MARWRQAGHGLYVRTDVLSGDGQGPVGLPAVKEEPQAHGRTSPRADRPSGYLARDHKAGGPVEPGASRMGQLLQRWHYPQSVSGARQLHGYAVAPVVALQAQSLATQGRSLSTLAPLRASRARTPDPAWAWPVVGEGVTSWPRAGCGRSACPVRSDGCGNGAAAEPVRHRQTKGAATDMFVLPPPRHISPLRISAGAGAPA